MNLECENFVAMISDLVYHSTNQYQALINKALTKSKFLEFTKHQQAPLKLDVLNIQLLGSGVSNDGEKNPNELYVQALTSKDKDGKDIVTTVGDVMAFILQGDYLAAMRRSYIFGHATPVRRRAFSAARLKGHGFKGSGIFERVGNQIKTIQEAVATGLKDEPKEKLTEEQKLEFAITTAKNQLQVFGFTTGE